MFKIQNKKTLLIAVLLLIGILATSAVYLGNSKGNAEEITVLNEPDEEKLEETEATDETNQEPQAAETSESENQSAPVDESVKEKPKEEVKKEEKVVEQPQVKQPVKEKAVEKKQGTVTTYKSNKLGATLTFPANWQNKYQVQETQAGIIVSYIFQHDYYCDYYGNRYQRENKTRYLFCIEDTSLLSENDLSTIDKIKNVDKFKIIHGKKYVIGGPTDCLETNDPDRAEVNQFLNDLPGIINNIKEI